VSAVGSMYAGFYSAVAIATVFLHPLFIVWVVFGAFLTRSRPVLRWLHIVSCLGNLHRTPVLTMFTEGARKLV